ncbi:MAG: class I SAM-dependent methyltransferase [Terracidiphilus sp.]
MDSKENAAYWEANAETWTQLSRAGHDVYRDGQNTPAFLAMLPPLVGLRGLDIGCGEGENTRRVARLGARMNAIDIAPTFVRHAQAMETKQPLGIEYELGDGAALSFGDASFDFVTAFMSLMDMPYLPQAMAEIKRVLRPGGFVQASILHPCFCPPYRKPVQAADGSIRAIEVARYFDRADGEIETWCFSTIPLLQKLTVRPFQIPRFHRTLSEWFDTIYSTGLVLEQLGEPNPTDDELRAYPKLADTRVAPLFLHFRARKPA